DVDHHADGITWGIELTSDLPILAQGSVHEVFEKVAHSVLAEGFIREIDASEVLDHAPQDVILLELGQQFGEFEGAPHFAHVVGEGIKVGEHAFYTVDDAAADDTQRYIRDVIEGPAVVRTDKCAQQAFEELGVFVGLQHRRLRRLEENLQTTQNREGEDVIAVGLAGDNTSQIGVRSLPDCLVERSR